MTLNLRMPEERDLRPHITVFGVGGAGGNAVNNMIEKRLEGVEFVVANTDSQALAQTLATRSIQLGVEVTQGLGAGAKPDIGSAAAMESIEAIVDHLAGSHMCFITAGMGGGTGTGAAPIIAKTAREMGILTVGVVTKPFSFEGTMRMRIAEEGIAELQTVVDTLIIIPNQNLFRIANERTTFTEAFMMADDVLFQGVKGVTDLMVRPGIINLDFADVRSVMDEMGKAMMGTGEGSGEERAIEAAEKAIANPLLDEVSLKGARGVLINVTGGPDLTLFELDEAANRIRSEVDPDANIIVGSTLDPEMEGMMRVSVVATGMEAEASLARPQAAASAGTVPPEQVDAAVEAEAEAEPESETETETHVSAAEAAIKAFIPPRDPLKDEPQRPAASAAPAPGPDPRTEPARRAGEPSPEILRRLQAAVNKVPDQPGKPAADASAQTVSEDDGRGTLNRLIHRMTGQSHHRDAPERQPPTLRGQPRKGEEDEQARIEIPAFLRRQAN